MDSLSTPNAMASRPLLSGFDSMPNPRQSPEAVGKAFESMFASMMIKEMRQTLDSETMFGKDSGDVLGGLFDQMLGDHLGKSGCLGIGAIVRAQLERRGSTI